MPSNNIVKERSSNFELLRIVSIFIIICMHTYHQGISDLDFVLFFNQLLGLTVNAIGNVGVSCFILIGGYFGVKFRLDRFVQIILLTTVYPFLICFLTLSGNIKELLLSGMVVPFYQNWCMSCYLMLMVLTPIINNVTQYISKINFEKILLSQFVVYSFFVFIQPHEMKYLITSAGKCFAYFLFIYMVGRYNRMYKDIQVKRFWITCKWLLMPITAILVTIVAGKVMGMGLHFPKALVDCSPFMFISAICVFYLFKGFKIQSNVVNKISSETLSIYLLERIRIPIDNWLFHLKDYVHSYSFFYISYFLCLLLI